MGLLRWSAPILALGLLAGACGDDDESSSTTSEPRQITTFAPSADLTKVCALAQQMYESDTIPTAAQVQEYQQLVPDELKDATSVVATAVVDANGDTTAFFVNMADDDVEAALAELDAFEEANCGIPHSADGTPLASGATQEVEDGATKVAVTAKEYEFTFDEPIEAGRTSFVVTNEGKQAHYLGVTKLKDGVSLQDALDAEDPSTVTDGSWDTKTAAPGGKDDEAVTFDLEPGNYAFVCFLPSADGTPHAYLGMAQPFTVH